MACLHKFARHLSLERLDFEPAVLIVGTFSPSWSCLNNYAEWFYGRTRNNYFWDVLPRLYGEDDLRTGLVGQWQEFCRRRRIALTDLLYRINDADPREPVHRSVLASYRDEALIRHFRHLDWVNVPGLLAQHPGIRTVYFTRGRDSSLWGRRWRLVADYGAANGISVQTLLTPSGGARFQMPPHVGYSLRDFIFYRWRAVWQVNPPTDESPL